jgi:hypothetical protein
MPALARHLADARAAHVRPTVRGSGAGVPPSSSPLFADEPPPRWAEIAPDESIAIVTCISPTRGPITGEMARGATLRLGEWVLVCLADDAWAGVVRRVSSRCGALVEELATLS